jgi:PHD/YefM family antitoxin component YafN of YafNO toxin-antitoxin module
MLVRWQAAQQPTIEIPSAIMSAKLPIRELPERVQQILDRAIRTGQECVVERNGKDYAVIVSARAWRRRTVGRLLDKQGPGLRLDSAKQLRAEQLLAKQKAHRLTRVERRSLNNLLRECDALIRRRADAMDRLS